MDPVHYTGNDVLDRHENGLEQIPERIQQRRNEIINRPPYCAENIPYNCAKRCDHGFDEGDFERNIIVILSP